MARSRRPSTSYSSASTSYPTYLDETGSATTRPNTARTSTSTGRPKSGRPRTATSTTHGGLNDQQIICAISESRGISPVVGLAFVNLTTTEAVLCQISDNQTFVRTIHKLFVFQPSEILFMNTAVQPKSKLFAFVEANAANYPSSRFTFIDRKYWSETAGIDYIQQLAFKQDIEAVKVSVGGNFYATCCIAAALKYIELVLSFSFSFHSLRIKYEPSEGSMMIDLSTIQALELIQNLQNAKSKDCLYGLLNQTVTPMGARLLKNNVLQPLIELKDLEERYDAIEELATKEDVFFAVQQALKAFVDVDRVLTTITVIPTQPSIQYWENSINNVILLKQYIKSVPPIFDALVGVKSNILKRVAELCSPERILDFHNMIDGTINEDITYQSQPLDLRNQRTYAVKSGVNGLLDVARQTYKEANADAYQLVADLGQIHELALELKYDPARQYYIRVPASELEERNLPEVFINQFRRKTFVECQTLDLLKWNQKIADSHHEVLQMSDQSVQDLIDTVREDIAPLFKICEAVALLDMITSFAQLVTTREYCRPELTQTLAIKNGRHPIQEKVHQEKFIPNDAYATQQSRFQIITGCNMSGKSTYIRSLALMAIMAQVGSFVPATYASFPIIHQLFARVSLDDSIEANVSTFATEMRETAFILRNVDERSMVIIDELGRGTSTRDGLCIAIAIAEALVDSKALVWFATHFRDLAKILAERNGVVNLHLAVEMGEADRMTMLYKISNGYVQEKHYGIALAKVLDIPSGVIEVAELVSKTIAQNAEKKKRSSKTIALARRRKLVLSLREQLVQAKEGNMQGKVLGLWLKKLQDEFVNRMSAIDAEIAAASEDEENEEQHEFDEDAVSGRLGQAGRELTVDSKGDGQYMMTGALQTEDWPTDVDVSFSMSSIQYHFPQSHIDIDMALTSITVLISGNGSNLQAIIDACRNSTIPNAAIIRVISNREKAYGLERAKRANIPTAYLNLLKYKKQHPATAEGIDAAREAYFEELASMVLEDRPDIVVCAGWMLIVTPSFLDKLAAAKVPIINLHPALPGEFNGINAIERAYEAFQQGKIQRTGIMIHYVIKEVDEGEPIVTKELAFKPGETLNEVEGRIHELEWQAIVEGTKIAIDTVLQARTGTAYS